MKKNIVKATFLVSIMTLLNKPLGFIREAIMASVFGMSVETDAFFLAQNMPSLLFPSVCTALSTAFISIYIDKCLVDGEKLGNEFANKALVFNTLLAGALSILSIMFAPIIVKILAPGFDESTLNIATNLTRVMMLSFAFLMIEYTCNGGLTSKEFYIGSQISGIIFNIIIISFLIIFGSKYGVIGLTTALVIGHIIQSVILFIINNRRIPFRFPRVSLIDSDIKYMLKLSIPILIGNSIIQLNNIVDKMVASNLQIGAISALSYSNTLNNFVIAIIITSLVTVFYPLIIECISKLDYVTLNKSLNSTLFVIMLTLMPISIITYYCSYDIVNIAFGRGEFSQANIKLTALVLKCYSISYIFIGFREVLVKVFYAAKDMNTPMKNGLISVSINIVLSIILSNLVGIKGVPIATSIANIFTFILLLRSIKLKIKDIKIDCFGYSFIKIIISNLISFIIIALLDNFLIGMNSLFRFSIITILYLCVYSIIIYFLKIDEVNFLLNTIKKKFIKCH